MRWLVLSDVHASLEAVTAVLRDARECGFDRSLLLGDVVGYGASPNEVIALLRELEPLEAVMGNHDRAALDGNPPEGFNQVAATAILWTREALDTASREWLAALPDGPREAGGILLAHGSPLDENDYILTPRDAREVFDAVPFRIGFVGHTHLASAFVAAGSRVERRWLQDEEAEIALEPEARYLVNPGSIGQPRDSDPRASYALYDEESRRLAVRRVPYDIDAAARRIAAAGLPPILGRRLAMGI